MSSYFVTLFHFFLGELAILGELASVLVGLGTKIWVQVPLFAAVLFGMKDLFFVDGGEV